MKKDFTGKSIPRFSYDTPTRPQVDFYALCDDDRPLVLVFLPNYGHPVSRVYLNNYIDTLDELRISRIACVVRSKPEAIAKSMNGAEFPFPLICDAQGVLYDYFGVEQTTGRMNWSFAAARIFREAKRQGYVMDKNSTQQLPLTMVIGRQGKVLFAHYGESLTDLPEDCIAVESVVRHLLETLDKTGASAVHEENLTAAAPEEAAPAEAAEAAEEDLGAALAEGNAADVVPEQSEPDLEADTREVLIPGAVHAAAPEEPAAEETAPAEPEEPDDGTLPIDLGSWQGGASAAPQTDAAGKKEKWGKLLGFFSDNN